MQHWVRQKRDATSPPRRRRNATRPSLRARRSPPGEDERYSRCDDARGPSGDHEHKAQRHSLPAVFFTRHHHGSPSTNNALGPVLMSRNGRDCPEETAGMKRCAGRAPFGAGRRLAPTDLGVWKAIAPSSLLPLHPNACRHGRCGNRGQALARGAAENRAGNRRQSPAQPRRRKKGEPPSVAHLLYGLRAAFIVSNAHYGVIAGVRGWVLFTLPNPRLSAWQAPHRHSFACENRHELVQITKPTAPCFQERRFGHGLFHSGLIHPRRNVQRQSQNGSPDRQLLCARPPGLEP
jgi:hypothetical protein